MADNETHNASGATSTQPQAPSSIRLHEEHPFDEPVSKWKKVLIEEFLPCLGVQPIDVPKLLPTFHLNAIFTLGELLELDKSTTRTKQLILPALLNARLITKLNQLQQVAENNPSYLPPPSTWFPKLYKATFAGLFSFKEPTIFEFKDNFLFLVGPNGAGKSNFAKALMTAIGAISYLNSFDKERNIHLSLNDEVFATLWFEINGPANDFYRTLIHKLPSLYQVTEQQLIEHFAQHVRKVRLHIAEQVAENGNKILCKTLSLLDNADEVVLTLRFDAFCRNYWPDVKQQPLLRDVPDNWFTSGRQYLENNLHMDHFTQAIAIHSSSAHWVPSQSKWAILKGEPLLNHAIAQLRLGENRKELDAANEQLFKLCGWRLRVIWSHKEFAKQLNEYNNKEELLRQCTSHTELASMIKILSYGSMTAGGVTIALESMNKQYDLERIIKDTWSQLISFSNDTRLIFEDESGKHMELQSLSSGVYDILTIILMMHFTNTPNIILDEPGASLHPPKRVELLNFLLQAQKCQIAVITHSQEFISTAMVRYTYHCYNENHNTTIQRLEDINIPEKERNMLLEPSLKSLLFVEKVLFIEGYTDDVWMQYLTTKVFEGTLPFALVRLEGCDKLLRLVKLVAHLNIQWAALLDGDTLSTTKQQDESVQKNVLDKAIAATKQAIKASEDKIKLSLSESLVKLLELKISTAKKFNNASITHLNHLLLSIKQNLTKNQYDKIGLLDASEGDAAPSLVSKIIPDIDSKGGDDEKRKICRKNKNPLFIWKEDPECIVAAHESVAVQLYRAKNTKNKAIKDKTDEALIPAAQQWAKGPLHDDWRQISPEDIGKAIATLLEVDDEVKDFVQFLKDL